MFQLYVVYFLTFSFSNDGLICKQSTATQPQKKKSNVTPCPACGKERTNMKVHLVLIHSMDPENAVALKSQLDLYKKRKRLPVDMRKTKIREYKRRICPLCSKGVTRLENHLRATYKIKNDKKFRHVMDEAR